MCKKDCKECCGSCDNKAACMEYSHTIYLICETSSGAKHYIKRVNNVPLKKIMAYLRDGALGETVFFTRERAKEVLKWKEKQPNE